MSYYASNNAVSTDSGAVEITKEQYLTAIDKMCNGQRIAIIDSAVVFYMPPVFLLDADDFLAASADVLPDGAPLIVAVPDASLLKPKWISGAWGEGASAGVLLANAQATQSQVVNTCCQLDIYAGFVSNALGSEHIYPAKQTDQANLVASVTASLYPGLSDDWTTPFWCADAADNWAYLPHTAAQIQQAGADGKAAILANLSKCATLQSQIAAATTVAAVESVTW